MMEKGYSNSDPFARHRSQYKCTTPPWKETYKKRCKERLRLGREKFLDKFRHIKNTETPVDFEVEKVMDEEWSRIAVENCHLPAWKPNKYSCRPFDADKLDAREETELNGLLEIMEEIQRELIEEEQNILRQYDENQRYEEEFLCAAIDKLSTDDVICPICKRNALHQNKQLIFCKCGTRIDTEYDAVDLSYVRTQLEDSIVTHREEGCLEEPVFSVSTAIGLGVSNLLAKCQNCGFMYIVL